LALLRAEKDRVAIKLASLERTIEARKKRIDAALGVPARMQLRQRRQSKRRKKT
jgi:hypothetical protein